MQVKSVAGHHRLRRTSSPVVIFPTSFDMFQCAMKPIISLLLGATVVLAASRTTTPTGCIHVAKSGGTYATIQAALNSLSTTSTTAQCIFVDQGTYNEQVSSLASIAGPLLSHTLP